MHTYIYIYIFLNIAILSCATVCAVCALRGGCLFPQRASFHQGLPRGLHGPAPVQAQLLLRLLQASHGTTLLTRRSMAQQPHPRENPKSWENPWGFGGFSILSFLTFDDLPLRLAGSC